MLARFFSRRKPNFVGPFCVATQRWRAPPEGGVLAHPPFRSRLPFNRTHPPRHDQRKQGEKELTPFRRHAHHFSFLSPSKLSILTTNFVLRCENTACKLIELIFFRLVGFFSRFVLCFDRELTTCVDRSSDKSVHFHHLTPCPGKATRHGTARCCR